MMNAIEKDIRYADIEMSARELMITHTEMVDKKTVLSDRLEKASSIFFLISVLGGFIAIFSEFWISMPSLAFAILGCILLIYKSKSNLNNDIDIHLWLSERSRILYEDSVKPKDVSDISLAENRLSSLKCIIEDFNAYRNNEQTAMLSEYYAARYNRNRYSAAIKNKYNKHEVKNLM